MNQLRLSASVAERGALRFTPAAVPALDVQLEHSSSIQEAGQTRQVQLALKAVALGAVAERLGRQDVGSRWCFTGFLSSPRNQRQVVFHIQDFQQDSIQGGS